VPDAGVAVAIVVASAGVALAMFGGRGWVRSALSIDFRGVLLLTAASVAFAVVAAVARVLAREVHPLRASGLGLAATAAALSLVVAARSPSLSALAALPGRDLAILAYTGVFATGGAYLAFVLGLALSRSAAAGLAATLIEPGVAALLAAMVLRERLAAAEALGCALMLAAMVVLFLAERRVAAATRSAAGQAARIT
jgi:DME family drug/metabolite transporter